MPSQANSDIPASSASVVMLSAPDTQDNPQDVFHTPPEEASLHSSDVDVPLCAVNQADAGSQVFVDSVDSSGFVDCRKDSDLGFSEEDQLKDEIDAGFVPENLRGVVSVEFRVLERDISDLGESPAKKLKLGFQEDSLPRENVVGGEQVNADADSCREIPMDENSVPEENVETQVAPNAGDVNLNEGNNSICEVGEEGSGMHEDPLLRVLPDSIRSLSEKETASGLESGRVEEKKKYNVFDVLKFLAETSDKKEDDGLTLLETLKRSGVNLPRPSWWPEDMKSQLFNFDDKEERK
ncbi:hypothetical protein MtrunA17_Chr1g0170051 [Medicago truncatula]|uniref:Uncharacterized protein n=1 Tax=Medicago truncatula TaxID=3880 RepID=A0A396JKP8_MEDTR|nr:hypothetical protein MtrunA17_Chr1g0170051 [Medicago truncatula]